MATASVASNLALAEFSTVKKPFAMMDKPAAQLAMIDKARSMAGPDLGGTITKILEQHQPVSASQIARNLQSSTSIAESVRSSASESALEMARRSMRASSPTGSAANLGSVGTMDKSAARQAMIDKARLVAGPDLGETIAKILERHQPIGASKIIRDLQTSGAIAGVTGTSTSEKAIEMASRSIAASYSTGSFANLTSDRILEQARKSMVAGWPGGPPQYAMSRSLIDKDLIRASAAGILGHRSLSENDLTKISGRVLHRPAIDEILRFGARSSTSAYLGLAEIVKPKVDFKAISGLPEYSALARAGQALAGSVPRHETFAELAGIQTVKLRRIGSTPEVGPARVEPQDAYLADLIEAQARRQREIEESITALRSEVEELRAAQSSSAETIEPITEDDVGAVYGAVQNYQAEAAPQTRSEEPFSWDKFWVHFYSTGLTAVFYFACSYGSDAITIAASALAMVDSYVKVGRYYRSKR